MGWVGGGCGDLEDVVVVLVFISTLASSPLWIWLVGGRGRPGNSGNLVPRIYSACRIFSGNLISDI